MSFPKSQSLQTTQPTSSLTPTLTNCWSFAMTCTQCDKQITPWYSLRSAYLTTCMKSTRIKESKAPRFKVLKALKSALVVLVLCNAGNILFSFNLISGIYFLPLSLYRSVFLSVCFKRSHSTINIGAPVRWGRKGPALSLRMPKVLTKQYALISTRRNCYQMQFEYLVSLLTLQWRLWTTARGGVSGSLVKNLISLERELYAALYLFVHRLPQRPHRHTHALLPCSGTTGGHAVPACLDCTGGGWGRGRCREATWLRYMVFMRGCREGSNEPQWLETNVEDCECFQGNVNQFKSLVRSQWNWGMLFSLLMFF